VPQLFTEEELERIHEEMAPHLQQAGTPQTPRNLIAAFTARTRARLHMVLCFSPVGEPFRRRLRLFPALVNCCTIDWFSEWSAVALASVATSTLKETALGTLSHGLQNAVVRLT
jgi:dynein heavy chain